MQQNWLPYCGAAPLPSNWLSQWNFDPAILVVLGLAAVWTWRWAQRPAAGFWAIGLAAILFISPICALTSALFSVRVIHHVVLTAIIAPLVIIASGNRFSVGGHPAIWAVLHTALFWAWHSPSAYASALSSDPAYWLMQTSLLLSALAFWSSILRGTAPTMIGVLLAMMVQMGLLGALITFANAPLYAPHWLTTQPWGLSPIEDQQLAGLIMWAPASLFYLAGALWAMWRHLSPPRAAVA